MKTEILNTQQAGALIERRLKAAKVVMTGTGANLLAESRLARPRGFVKKLSSPPPLIQIAPRTKVSYSMTQLTQWTNTVLIPHLKTSAAKGNTLETEVISHIPSSLQPTPLHSELVQKNADAPLTEKEAFLSELITLSFKMSDTVIRNDSFSKAKFGAIPRHRLRSAITLSVIQEATGVDILKTFDLVHAPVH